VESTWEARDLPVLDAAVRYVDDNGPMPGPYGHHLAELTGLPMDDVARAMDALDGEYIEVTTNIGPGPERWRVSAVSPDARRVVGQWPTPEALADRILAALRDAAENEADPGRRGRLRHLADAATDAGSGLLTKVIAEVIARQTGLG